VGVFFSLSERDNVHLSQQKIAIPKGVRLKCVSWNSDQGWVACGGESGLLKVLKLDSAPSDKKAARGVAAPSNLSMNQTLEGHSGPVMCVTWNANYRKLTTSDGYGLIIVWMLHKGMWFEEMINNRNKSTVSDMKWTSNGQKICIIYEDGAVIVGSVDGNRMWGKDLNLELSFVEWSPDGRNIIFVTKQGEALVFDGNGNKLSKIQLLAQKRQTPVIGIHWYDGKAGHVITNAPTLAIAFQDGKVQLICGPHDDSPILIDTGLQLTQCRWNHNGSVLALAGTARTKLSNGETRDISMVQFYLPTGQHLNQLKVPGSGISALSWEGTGLRIALGVGAYIYFANIRPDYKWSLFLNTLVYSFQKLDRPEQCVMFWNSHPQNDERYLKYVKNLLFIRAAGTHCCLINDMNDGTGQYAVSLCNAIGAPVQIKYTEIEPCFACMTLTHIIVASSQDIYIWQYDSGAKKVTAGITNDLSIYHLPSNLRSNKEASFHVDETNFDDLSADEFVPEVDANNDPISCITASDKYLIIGRTSGSVHRYTLPHISLENKYTLSRQPKKN
jgi:WD repeat-containing protein 35